MIKLCEFPLEIKRKIAKNDHQVWYLLAIVDKEFGFYSIQGQVKKLFQKRFKYEEIKNDREHSHKLNGQLCGLRRLYHSNGQLWVECNYQNGSLHGVCKFYYYTGELMEESNYQNDIKTI
jgi:hypothetical protein